MPDYTRYQHRNKPGPKRQPGSAARKYEDGYLSRASLGIKLGLKSMQWAVVQKALCRVGYLHWRGGKYVPTEEGLKYCRLHEELQNDLEVKSWYVWSPLVVEHIREAVAWVLANPNTHPVTGKATGSAAPVVREYPAGFESMSMLAAEAGVTSLFAVRCMEDWGITQRVQNKVVPVPSAIESGDAKMYSEGDSEWPIFSVRFVSDLREEFAERAKNLKPKEAK